MTRHGRSRSHGRSRLAGPMTVVLLSSMTAGLSTAPGSAAADGPATTTTATVVSELGDWIGRGRAYAVHPGSGTVQVAGGPSDVVVDISAAGTSGEGGSFSVRLMAPAGGRLVPGDYEHVHHALDSPEPDRAGLRVFGNGRSCVHLMRGRFTVLDIAYTADTVERLHVLYEQHCEGWQEGIFGEIRYRVPATHVGMLAVPGRVAWPPTYPGVAGRPVPVTLVNTGTGPVELGPPTIDSDESGSFGVVSSTCSGELVAGASCIVHVRFTPASAGAHAAVLDLAGSTTAGIARVPLSGSGHSGTTSWQLRGQAIEQAGGHVDDLWTTADAGFRVIGTADTVRVQVGTQTDGVQLDLSAGTGQALTPGRTYSDVPDHAPGQAGPGLSVVRNGYGCGPTTSEFTVHEIAVSPDGLERLSLTFEEHCGPQVLHGSLAYRAATGAHPVPGNPAPVPQQPEPEPRFSDLEGNVHAHSVLAIADAGITVGYADGTYRPHLVVTRGQMASYFSRALQLPAAAPGGFSDTAGSMHEAAIDAVAAAGIVGGYGDGSYRPDLPITRAQMASFLARARGLPPADRHWFTDTAGDVHEAAIDAVAQAGFAGGYGDGRFDPARAVRRDQVASFLARAFHVLG